MIELGIELFQSNKTEKMARAITLQAPQQSSMSVYNMYGPKLHNVFKNCIKRNVI